jgi:hypothetical protein
MTRKIGAIVLSAIVAAFVLFVGSIPVSDDSVEAGGIARSAFSWQVMFGYQPYATNVRTTEWQGWSNPSTAVVVTPYYFVKAPTPGSTYIFNYDGVRSG